MLRLAGILIGSALAIGFLVIMIGKPQLTAPTPQSPTSSSSGTVTLSSGEDKVTVPAPTPSTGIEVTVPEPEDKVTVPELEDKVTVPELGELEAVLVDQVFAAEAEREAILPASPEPDAGEHWYAFWSPFRSEIAAQGFVSRLQETTGIDYRVVKVKTGVYEVAFAYTDDADIQAKLERISSATGLDMSGG